MTAPYLNAPSWSDRMRQKKPTDIFDTAIGNRFQGGEQAQPQQTGPMQPWQMPVQPSAPRPQARPPVQPQPNVTGAAPVGATPLQGAQPPMAPVNPFRPAAIRAPEPRPTTGYEGTGYDRTTANTPTGEAQLGGYQLTGKERSEGGFTVDEHGRLIQTPTGSTIGQLAGGNAGAGTVQGGFTPEQMEILKRLGWSESDLYAQDTSTGKYGSDSQGQYIASDQARRNNATADSWGMREQIAQQSGGRLTPGDVMVDDPAILRRILSGELTLAQGIEAAQGATSPWQDAAQTTPAGATEGNAVMDRRGDLPGGVQRGLPTRGNADPVQMFHGPTANVTQGPPGLGGDDDGGYDDPENNVNAWDKVNPDTPSPYTAPYTPPAPTAPKPQVNPLGTPTGQAPSAPKPAPPAARPPASYPNDPALDELVGKGLANPSRYDEDLIRSMWESRAGDIDTQFDMANRGQQEQLSRQGIRDSTFGGERMLQLAGERRSAKSRALQDMLEGTAATMSADRSRAISDATGVRSQRSNDDQFAQNADMARYFGLDDRRYRDEESDWRHEYDTERFNADRQDAWDQFLMWLNGQGQL